MELPVIIDVEASALGAGSYPIEVGIALSSGGTHCFLLQPAPEWERWDPQSEAMHGINREILFTHGQPLASVAARLNELLGGNISYSDAWSFDSSWLALLFHRAGVKQRFRLESLRSLLTEEQVALWHPVKEKVLSELALSRHRASMDARVLQLTYERTAELARSPLASAVISPSRLS